MRASGEETDMLMENHIVGWQAHHYGLGKNTNYGMEVER
jgi:hypothetical protein